jgi:ribosomal protection tetracycline resistance protein
LLLGIETLLPPVRRCCDAPLAGIIFKILRNRQGEKLVFARIFSGSLAMRLHLPIRGQRDDSVDDHDARITGIDLFERGSTIAVSSASAGEIVRLHGIKDARIGDFIGDGSFPEDIDAAIFPPPALESAVRPVDPRQMTRLGIALQHLTEQDPLIGLRRGDREGELFLHLFGDVQKEVIAETLALDFGVEVQFAESQVLHIERPLGTGHGYELIGSDENPFAATVGIRIERAEPASGIRYAYEPGSLPHAFYRAIEETVMETLEQGLNGWPVTDCLITLTDVGYWSPITVASDFRLLTPLVVMQALQEAGTEVCEPIETFDLEIPAESIGETLSALVAARAIACDISRQGEACHLSGTIPSAEVHLFEQRLPGISRGLGIWTSNFKGYVPVAGIAPERIRIGRNSLNRKLYLAECAQG